MRVRISPQDIGDCGKIIKQEECGFLAVENFFGNFRKKVLTKGKPCGILVKRSRDRVQNLTTDAGVPCKLNNVSERSTKRLGTSRSSGMSFAYFFEARI